MESRVRAAKKDTLRSSARHESPDQCVSARSFGKISSLFGAKLGSVIWFQRFPFLFGGALVVVNEPSLFWQKGDFFTLVRSFFGLKSGRVIWF